MIRREAPGAFLLGRHMATARIGALDEAAA